MKECKCCNKKLVYLDSVKKSYYDSSVFNDYFDVFYCEFCKVIEISNLNLTDKSLKKYYENFVIYSDYPSSNTSPGGFSDNDQIRYNHYSKFINKDSKIVVDVGSSQGGFVYFLKKKFKNINVFGVDLDQKSIQKSSMKNLEIIQGSLFDLPFEENSIDLLTYFHVFEHVNNLSLLCDEARKKLKNKGQIIIEVPNAENYNTSDNSYIGPLYWLFTPEHIYHFTKKSLSNLLINYGFEIKEISESYMPLKGKYKYPSLLVVAQKKTSQVNKNFYDFDLIDYHPGKFYEKENMFANIICKKLENYLSSNMIFWGMSYEFFAFWSKLQLDEKNGSFKFFDLNEAKTKLTFDSNRISFPKFYENHKVFISSYMSSNDILNDAIKLGWKQNSVLSINNLWDFEKYKKNY